MAELKTKQKLKAKPKVQERDHVEVSPLESCGPDGKGKPEVSGYMVYDAKGNAERMSKADFEDKYELMK